MNKEICIVENNPNYHAQIRYYGNTTNNSTDYENYEWINGVLFIHINDSCVHVFNPANKLIKLIKINEW